MARMSIDDMAKRDPRFLMLVRLCGWSKRETWGAITDVWEICYDRKTHILPVVEINETILSGAPPGTPYDFGFSDKMLACGLARRERGIPKNCLAIVGAEKRIKYLLKSEEAGRIGGLKSAQLRKSGGKGKSSDPQGSLNLIATVPDPVPDLDPDRSPDPDPGPGTGASPGAPSLSSASPVTGQDTPKGNGEPSAQRPALHVVTGIDELAAEVSALHVAAYERVRTKRRIDVPSLDTPRAAIRRLLGQLVADGLTEADIRTKCMHALTVREAEADKKETLEWFGERAWLKDNFKASLTRSLADVTGKKPSKPSRVASKASEENGGPKPASLSFSEFMKSIDDPEVAALAEETFVGIDYDGKENTS